MSNQTLSQNVPASQIIQTILTGIKLDMSAGKPRSARTEAAAYLIWLNPETVRTTEDGNWIEVNDCYQWSRVTADTMSNWLNVENLPKDALTPKTSALAPTPEPTAKIERVFSAVHVGPPQPAPASPVASFPDHYDPAAVIRAVDLLKDDVADDPELSRQLEGMRLLAMLDAPIVPKSPVAPKSLDKCDTLGCNETAMMTDAKGNRYCPKHAPNVDPLLRHAIEQASSHTLYEMRKGLISSDIDKAALIDLFAAELKRRESGAKGGQS